MKQYCRYCANANIIDDDLYYCQPKKQVFSIAKSKRLNKCKDFDFCENDLWRFDENGNFQTYKPREKYTKHNHEKMEQLTIEAEEAGHEQ